MDKQSCEAHTVSKKCVGQIEKQELVRMCSGPWLRFHRGKIGDPGPWNVHSHGRWWLEDTCVHLRAHVHRVSGASVGSSYSHHWIMSQHFCEKPRRHARQR